MVCNFLRNNKAIIYNRSFPQYFVKFVKFIYLRSSCSIFRFVSLKVLFELKTDNPQQRAGTISSLQTLDEFHVENGDEGNKLEDLKDLDQLQGSLAIELWEKFNIAENEGILLNKPHLSKLRLKFPWRNEGEEGEMLNMLKPHPALESLVIFHYKGSAFSDWLSSLHNLRVLSLERCRNCKILPPLGKLASLESLLIKKLHGVSKVGIEFLGIEQGQTSTFPKLKHLSIVDMESWEEWEGVEEVKFQNIAVMPCLSNLTIKYCKLKALPDFLWKTPLQKSIIRHSIYLQELYRPKEGAEWAKISHIPSINTDES